MTNGPNSPWSPKSPWYAMPQGQLAKSRRNRMLWGVCGGIADWVGWDPTLVRILYVLVSVVSTGFPGILVYVILLLIMPEGDD